MSKSISLRIIAAIAAIVGLVVLLNSTTWGFRARDNIIAQRGGLGGGDLTIATQEPMIAYRTLGGIFLGVGLYCALAPFTDRSKHYE